MLLFHPIKLPAYINIYLYTYHTSQMKKSEVLLFKIFDSDTTRPARCTFHTSFFNPHADPSLPPRESIDMRCLAFFPDHEPNTCPPLGSEVSILLQKHKVSLTVFPERVTAVDVMRQY